MRPISLTMKAFGSFAEKTEVQFSEITASPFLILGETGAGKTTIFDAIVFALYGAASGTSRTPEMMHSDFVSKSEDTEVALTFEQGGKAYTAKRTIHFKKNRQTGEYSAEPPKATLTLPEKTAIEGGSRVTKRCEELLGLNAEQFRKIVMLAQGEFQEFLTADAKKKSDILGKLFGSAAYKRFETLLGDSCKALEEKRKFCLREIETAMKLFTCPEGDETPYLASDPALPALLTALLQREAEREAALRGEKEKTENLLRDLHTQKGKADGDNEKLDSLSAARSHLEALAAVQEEKDREEAAYARAERAERRVRPPEKEWNAAESAVSQAEQRVKALEGDVSNLEAEQKAALEAVEADAPHVKRVDDIKLELGNLNLSLYDELEALQRRLREEQEKHSNADQRKEAASLKKDALTKKSGEVKAELEALENAEAEKITAENAETKAHEDAEEFHGKGGIREKVEELLEEERTLAEDEARLPDLREKAAKAEKEHHVAYQRFLRGQAGLLAEELEQSIEEEGEAACPVCATRFKRGEPHSFALPPENPPTKEEIDRLRKAFQEADNQWKSKTEGLAERRKALTEKRDELFSRAQKLLGNCKSWETLSDAAYLVAEGERLNTAWEKAKQTLKEAKGRVSHRKELQETEAGLAEELEKLEQELKKAEADFTAADKAIAEVQAGMGALKTPYPTRKEAEDRKEALEQEQQRLQETIVSHQKALENAKDLLSEKKGALQGQKDALPALRKTAEEKREAFLTGLRENDFADADAYAAARLPMGADPEGWLSSTRTKLDEYKHDLKSTRETVDKLNQETAELTYTDLSKLNGQIEEANEAFKAAEKALGDQQRLLENHRSVLSTVSEARESLTRTDELWAQLDALAELAKGASGEGGRLSFERYVMGAFFREVLEMANSRLDTMSGGRYTLVHAIRGKAYTQSGLEIDVMDVSTGQQRPAGSLSGGETFEVSLALALGLSDAVQSHAGGVGLDALFIDEGFGALGAEALNNAIAVLENLSKGNRLVGIISHVDKLAESLPQKLRVEMTDRGSRIRLEK